MLLGDWNVIGAAWRSPQYPWKEAGRQEEPWSRPGRKRGRKRWQSQDWSESHGCRSSDWQGSSWSSRSNWTWGKYDPKGSDQNHPFAHPEVMVVRSAAATIASLAGLRGVLRDSQSKPWNLYWLWSRSSKSIRLRYSRTSTNDSHGPGAKERGDRVHPSLGVDRIQVVDVEAVQRPEDPGWSWVQDSAHFSWKRGCEQQSQQGASLAPKTAEYCHPRGESLRQCGQPRGSAGDNAASYRKVLEPECGPAGRLKLKRPRRGRHLTRCPAKPRSPPLLFWMVEWRA